MKKLFFLCLATLSIFSVIYADQFKIIYGRTGPQALTNIRLDLQVDNLYPLTTVTTSSVSPTDYSPTDSSITISLPDGYNRIYCSFNVPTESKTYFVAGTLNLDRGLNYMLGYNDFADNFFLAGPIIF